MTPPPQIFDRKLYARRRARAAKGFSGHDFLHKRVMEDVIDRLESVNRRFPMAVFDGAGELASQLTPACGVDEMICLDMAPARLPAAGLRVAADPEHLPINPESLDLFVSVLTLHTANDLVGALAQARMALKPDGLFIAAIFGEDTLTALRKSLYEAESELTGGVSARVSPFAGVRDYGAALQRASFALPVTDIDKVTVSYDDPLRLLADLRGMGEASALKNRSSILRRDVLMNALARFTGTGGVEHFDIVYLTGWAPHESQPKPLAPGSAITPLRDAIEDAS